LIVAILQGFLREFVVPLVALAPSPALPLLLQQPVASSMHPPSALFLTTDACVFPPVDDAFHQPAESDEDDDESESVVDENDDRAKQRMDLGFQTKNSRIR
jgi:hypothetical protein